jgi:hypothetical protein
MRLHMLAEGYAYNIHTRTPRMPSQTNRIPTETHPQLNENN